MSRLDLGVLPLRLSGAVMALSAPISLPAIPLMEGMLAATGVIGTNLAGGALFLFAAVRFFLGALLCQFGCDEEAGHGPSPTPRTAFGPGWGVDTADCPPS